jgi:urease accessory protein
VPLGLGLVAYLHALAANLISAGVRLVPLGQTDGQLSQAALESPIRTAADQAIHRPLDDFGSAAPMVDWTSMQHETQYTRLFRS